MPQQPDTTARALVAGLLSWLIPGAGHLFLGRRSIAAALFCGVTFAYGVGLAYGGIKNSVNPWSNHWLFLGEIGCGGYTGLGLLANFAVDDLPPQLVPHVLAQNQSPVYARMSSEQQALYSEKLRQYVSFYPESDVSQIFLASAGLLNILVIIDAVARANTGRPTYPAAATAPAGRPG